MMTALLSPTWVTMPDLIFGEVMLMVGIGNLECLHRCRQVCKYWNEKIMTIIWENSRNTKIIASSIEKTWAANLEVFPWTFPFSNEEIFHFANLEVFPWTFPSNEEISHFKWLETRGINIRLLVSLRERMKNILRKPIPFNSFLGIPCAASLAYHGLLGSVDYISLSDMDLTSVPTKHLNSLISSVTGTVYIASVRGCDLISVFESIKSQKLLIFKQRIGREETQALMRAMESSVEFVILGSDVVLDIRALSEYNGQGKCRQLQAGGRYYGKRPVRYRKELTSWARSRDWEMTINEFTILVITAVQT